MASIIVVESARGRADVGFWDYAKFGIPVTILTSVAGLGILLLLGCGVALVCRLRWNFFWLTKVNLLPFSLAIAAP